MTVKAQVRRFSLLATVPAVMLATAGVSFYIDRELTRGPYTFVSAWQDGEAAGTYVNGPYVSLEACQAARKAIRRETATTQCEVSR